MTINDTLRTDEPGQSRIVPTDHNPRGALGLLLQAYWLAQDAYADVWDFALEIDRLFEARLTKSDLRWLVAKGFAEHGQESSAYGAPHRSFRRGDGFFHLFLRRCSRHIALNHANLRFFHGSQFFASALAEQIRRFAALLDQRAHHLHLDCLIQRLHGIDFMLFESRFHHAQGAEPRLLFRFHGGYHVFLNSVE